MTTLLGPIERDRVTTLLGPLLEEGVVTTVVGPLGVELAALTVALAASYQSGTTVVPGLEPEGLGDVQVTSYVSSWADWRGLLAEVSDIAGVVDPPVCFQCLSEPLGQEKPVERDPEAEPFWSDARLTDIEADMEAARVTGRRFAPCLSIIFGYGMSAASGFGADMQALYRQLGGMTALVVDAETAFTAPSSAGTYGPIHRLADLRDTVGGLGDFLERVGARYVPDEFVVDDKLTTPAANGSRHRDDVYSLLDGLGIDAVRELVTDGRSPASLKLKALARERGLGPGALYHAATSLARDVIRPRRVAGRGPGVLFGHAAVFGQWREVDSVQEGRFLQRLSRGCFAKTILADRDRMKVTFRHGRNFRFGHRSLGPIRSLEEDSEGLRYEVELADADHCWELAPWLATGKYGGSLTFEVMRDTFVRRPGASAHNPDGLPEQTVTEVRVQELGPAGNPRYRGTSCGVRSHQQQSHMEAHVGEFLESPPKR